MDWDNSFLPYWILVIIAFWIIIMLYNEWEIRHPTKPNFCKWCGCPVIEVWEYNSKKFDEHTGKGVIWYEKYFNCTNYDPEKFYHTHIWANKYKSEVTESECSNV